MGEKGIVVAVDGHSSCGKSTFARAIATRLNYLYIDTGAMYRALTLAFIRAGAKGADQLTEGTVERVLLQSEVGYNLSETGEYRITLNGEALGDEIRGPEVSHLVSPVAAIPRVRTQLLTLQRALGAEGGVSMDGRDIGVAVFPGAELKIFMTASLEVRAKRRFLEYQAKGEKVTLEWLMENLAERDRIDETRACNPLRKAEGAIVLDNSAMSVAQQLEWIEPYLQKALRQWSETRTR